MTAQALTVEFKRGDKFSCTLLFPQNFEDGHFAALQVSSQVRTSSGELVANLDFAWDSLETTRALQIFKMETQSWPVGVHQCDVQFTAAGGGSISTETITIRCLKDVTRG